MFFYSNNCKEFLHLYYFLFRMYLTEAHISAILNSDFFRTSFTSRKVHYALYQGKINATVHTLRFNCNESFDPLTVRARIYQYLTKQFQTRLTQTILCSYWLRQFPFPLTCLAGKKGCGCYVF